MVLLLPALSWCAVCFGAFIVPLSENAYVIFVAQLVVGILVAGLAAICLVARRRAWNDSHDESHERFGLVRRDLPWMDFLYLGILAYLSCDLLYDVVHSAVGGTFGAWEAFGLFLVGLLQLTAQNAWNTLWEGGRTFKRDDA